LFSIGWVVTCWVRYGEKKKKHKDGIGDSCRMFRGKILKTFCDSWLAQEKSLEKETDGTDDWLGGLKGSRELGESHLIASLKVRDREKGKRPGMGMPHFSARGKEESPPRERAGKRESRGARQIL